MRSRYEPLSLNDPDQFRELRMLQELEEAPESSQRELSQKLGIALGLTNTILRNLGKKGFYKGYSGWLEAVVIRNNS